MLRAFFLLLFLVVAILILYKFKGGRGEEVLSLDVGETQAMFGSLPEKYFSYGPSLASDVPGLWEGTIVLDSEDFPDYSGGYFSAKIFLKFYVEDFSRNDFFQNKMDSLLRDDRVGEISSRAVLVNVDGSNDINYMSRMYHYSSRNLRDIEVLSIDGREVAIYNRLYDGEAGSGFNIIDQYFSNFDTWGYGEYQIKHREKNISPHLYFFMIENFLKGFR